jgi:hypothetical protein
VTKTRAATLSRAYETLNALLGSRYTGGVEVVDDGGIIAPIERVGGPCLRVREVNRVLHRSH